MTRWGVTADTLEDFLKKGTKSDAGVWSPFEKGRPDLLALTMNEIREQGRRGLIGMQMTAVCVEAKVPGKKKTEKRYRVPTEDELTLADIQEEDIEEVFDGIPYGVIDDPLPPQGSLGFRVQLYGFVNWRQLFTPRQLLAAGVFLKHTREAIAAVRQTDPDNAEALAVYLTVIFGRFIDYCSMQCSWEPSDGEVKQHNRWLQATHGLGLRRGESVIGTGPLLRRRHPRGERCNRGVHASLRESAGRASSPVRE